MGTADRVRKALHVYKAADALDRGAYVESTDEPVSRPPEPNSNSAFPLPSPPNSPPGPSLQYYNPHYIAPQYGAFTAPPYHSLQGPSHNNFTPQPHFSQNGQPQIIPQQQLAQQQQQFFYQQPNSNHQSFASQRPGLSHQPSASSSQYSQGSNGNAHTAQPQYDSSTTQPPFNGRSAYPQPQGSPVSDTQSLYPPPPPLNSNYGYDSNLRLPGRSQTFPTTSHSSIMHCGHADECWN